jgi:hypothetical protein
MTVLAAFAAASVGARAIARVDARAVGADPVLPAFPLRRSAGADTRLTGVGRAGIAVIARSAGSATPIVTAGQSLAVGFTGHNFQAEIGVVTGESLFAHPAGLSAPIVSAFLAVTVGDAGRLIFDAGTLDTPESVLARPASDPASIVTAFLSLTGGNAGTLIDAGAGLGARPTAVAFTAAPVATIVAAGLARAFRAAGDVDNAGPLDAICPGDTGSTQAPASIVATLLVAAIRYAQTLTGAAGIAAWTRPTAAAAIIVPADLLNAFRRAGEGRALPFDALESVLARAA